MEPWGYGDDSRRIEVIYKIKPFLSVVHLNQDFKNNIFLSRIKEL